MTIGYGLLAKLLVQQQAQVIELDVSHEIEARILVAIRLDPHLEAVEVKPQPVRVTSINAQYVPLTSRYGISTISLRKEKRFLQNGIP